MTAGVVDVWGVNERHTTLGLLARRLDEDPDGDYLEFSGEQYSAARTEAESGRVAALLRDLGVAKGDRVATLMDNSPEAVCAWFGALRLGAVPVPINTAYRADYLRHPLVDSGASVVVVDARYVERLAAVLTDVPDLRAVVLVGDGSIDLASIGLASVVKVMAWSEMDRIASLPLDPGVVAPADLATLIYTAGTTGLSKACMLSHGYVVHPSLRTAPAWGRTKEDRFWTPLPLFHFAVYQHVVVGVLAVGGTGSIGTRFSVSKFWPEMARTQSTMAALLGSMTTMLARAEGHAHEVEHRLRFVVTAPNPPEMEAIWRDRFGVETFSGGFGLTEAGPISLTLPNMPNKPGAAGLASTPDFDTRIFDDENRELAVGDVGEIVTRPRRAGVMFDGYWQRAEATAAAFTDLWFHTGDLGRVDEDGFLYFVDRKKDYLRRRGENISSFEVEAVFRAHEAVLEVAAHAVASEFAEDEVKVTITVRPGAVVDEEQLCRWAIERLPYFALPRYIELRDDLPRNPVGRILKYVLRDEGVTPSTWDREAAGVLVERY